MAGRAQPPAPAPDRDVADRPKTAAGAGAGTDRGTGASGGRRRSWLTWRRLPILLELATLGAAYMAPSLVRIVLTTTRSEAFGHAAMLYHAEADVGIDVEPWFNHLVAPHAQAALAVGYYYALLHFILTPLALAWLYVFRPRAFPRLRSALVLATIGANIVFWTWPVAPPRFAIGGMTDILTAHNVLDSADPHGVTGAANLYAALPSLHVAWATWCAVAVVMATRTRWRHLAWLYPAATTFVVLSSANHFVFDVAGGLLITGLGLAAARLPWARLPRPRSLSAAALSSATLSAAAFGAMAGVPIPAGAIIPVARAADPEPEPAQLGGAPSHPG
ncbi:MAG TPA: phosphatase PAP2 family protein [Streptosporangiaceae bacterium]|jgi:hypothetical protein